MSFLQLSQCASFDSVHPLKVQSDTLDYGLRDITYTPLPGIGRGTCPSRTEPLDKFLLRLPYRLADGVPPLEELNRMLVSGKDDAGMSGGAVWEPFEIDEEERQELLRALETRGSDYLDWLFSLEEEEHGIPAKEHRRLHDRFISLSQARDEAGHRGDPARFKSLEREAQRAMEEVNYWLISQTKGDEVAKQLRELMDAERQALGAVLDAEEEGDRDLVRDLRVRLSQVQRELAEFATQTFR